ncbi:MAG: deaminase [Acidimicrobiales bacterium]
MVPDQQSTASTGAGAVAADATMVAAPPPAEAAEVWDDPIAAQDQRRMAEALAMAEHGLSAGELPIGAVVVAGGRVVGRAFTQERTQGRLLVHAELLALDQADRTHAVTRVGTVLYTTLEPCLMCLGAAAAAMVDRVVYALRSPGDGTADLAALWDQHRRTDDLPHVRLPPVSGGVGAEEARDQFARFRAARSDSGDPLAAWAATLLRPTDSDDRDGAASADVDSDVPDARAFVEPSS